jgi:organic hydroperoxide reductase OsmC/OhrA
MKQHNYNINLAWTGNTGTGTVDYKAYRRDHVIRAAGKPDLPGSSDPAFRGDASRYNPEELLVAALSSCHMLWYLHLCAVNHIVVESYEDAASGVMEEDADGGGRFVSATLQPAVKLSAGDSAKALELHEQAHHLCFVANSVNFPVEVKGTIL